MGFDIQLQDEVLCALVKSTIAENLVNKCIPPFPPYYIDHIDVNNVTIAVRDGGATFDATTDVYIVQEASLNANVNTEPSEAINPAGQAIIILEMTIDGLSLRITCTNIRPGTAGNPNPLFEIALQSIKPQIISEIGSIDLPLGELISTIGLDTPTTSKIETLVSGVALRFDYPPTIAVDILNPTSRTWCLVISADTVMSLAGSKLRPMYASLASRGIGWSTRYQQYIQKNGKPHIDFVIPIWIPVAEAWGMSAEIQLGIDFSLKKQWNGAKFTQLVDWRVGKINTNTLPIAIPGGIESFLPFMLSALFDPTTIGGTPIDWDTFVIEQTIAAPKIGPSTFSIDSLDARFDGMAIGGIVSQPNKNNPRTEFIIEPFTERFTKWMWCRQAPSLPLPELRDGFASARCVVTPGVLCSVTILAPEGYASRLDPYKSVDDAVITFLLPISLSTELNATGQSLRLRVLGSRGARIIDLGLPPAEQRNQSGAIMNIDIRLMSDCASVAPPLVDPWVRYFHGFNPKWHVDPPPNWVDRMHNVGGFLSSVITVGNVKPNDTVKWHQPLDGGVSTISASAKSEVVIPTMMAIRSLDEGAKLEHVARSNLSTINVSTKLFSRVATIRVPGAISHELTTSKDGYARVMSTFADGTEITEIDNVGVIIQNQSRGERKEVKICGCQESGPSIIEPSSALPSHIKLDIAGLKATHAVPGFEDQGIAVAELDDGSFRSVTYDSTTGDAQVTGTIARWPRSVPHIEGSWAISSVVGDEVALFSVTDLGSEETCCGPCKEERAKEVFKRIMAKKPMEFVPKENTEKSEYT